MVLDRPGYACLALDRRASLSRLPADDMTLMHSGWKSRMFVTIGPARSHSAKSF